MSSSPDVLPPIAAPTVGSRLGRFSRAAARAAFGAWALGAVGILGIVLLTAGTTGPRSSLGSEVVAVVIVGSLVLFLLAFLVGGLAFVTGVPALRHREGRIGALVGLATSAVAFVSVIATTARGRQLREDGVAKMPPVAPGDAWAVPHARLDIPDLLRDSVAEAWRENGRTEHASVAAFARLSLELVALGAPPRLLIDAAQDAIDEIRHAEACFGLARDIDGQARSPAPFPEASTAGVLVGDRTDRLVALAIESLVDGALNEGMSAVALARLATRCPAQPQIAAILRQLAEDEARHAEHAWDVVAFCLEQGGDVVRRALASAADALPEHQVPLHPEAADGRWEPYGIPGRTVADESLAEVRAQVQSRVGPLVARGAA